MVPCIAYELHMREEYFRALYPDASADSSVNKTLHYKAHEHNWQQLQTSTLFGV